jgi:O-antigen ligase
MILTLSRGGFLTLTALALAAVITMPQRRVKVALLGGAVLGGLAISQVPYISIRLAHQLDPTYRWNTFEGRLQIWTDTLHMLRDHPIFGAGLRAYTQVMTPYVTPPRIPELYPHDIWLAMWSELGLLGLVAFVVLLAMLLWRGWRGFAAATGFWRPVLWGTAAAFVTIVVHGMVDTPYFKNDLALEFWIFAALEVAAIRIIAADATRNRALAR